MRVHHILNSRLRLRRSPSRRRGENLYEPVPTALLFLACSLRKGRPHVPPGAGKGRPRLPRGGQVPRQGPLRDLSVYVRPSDENNSRIERRLFASPPRAAVSAGPEIIGGDRTYFRTVKNSSTHRGRRDQNAIDHVTPSCPPSARSTATRGSARRSARGYRKGVNSFHAASSSSLRMNSRLSPCTTSKMRRSYASGNAPPLYLIDPLVRLNAEHELVRVLLAVPELLLVQVPGGVVKLHANLRLPLVQRLPSLNEERHAVPSRVVDEQRHRRERRASRPGGHGIVVEVSGQHAVAVAFALVLPEHDVVHVDRSDAADDLHLLVADVLRIQRRGLFHREQREDLQEVVLNHVAHDPVVVEVPASALGAKVFAEVDLHVSNVRPRPQRLEHDVAEPQDGEVFDEFLPEVVIDAVRVLLREVLRERLGQRSGGFQIASERLLDDDSRLPRLAADVPRRVLRDRDED
eukprot:31237-Pelagococcus_subviridis.AAC.18